MSKDVQVLGPLMMDIEGLTLTGEDRELLGHPLIGGFILFTRNFKNKKQLTELVIEIRKERPDILIAADYEGGRVQRFREGFTRIPPMRALGEAYEQNPARGRALAQACGWLMAAELREADIDLPFAPVLDIDTGVSEVIGDRAFHRDPDIIASLAVSLMAGLRDAGMAATGKHFPGHGHVAPDSHVELPVDERSMDEIEDEDIEPFLQMMQAGLPSVMMAHIRYPAVDDLPASLSHYWIQDCLRGEYGFDGAVFCDDLSMGGAACMGGYLERAEMALDAGCDMLPVCNNRAGVVEILDGLDWQPSPEASRRLMALKARALETPQDFSRYQAAQSLLASLTVA